MPYVQKRHYTKPLPKKEFWSIEKLVGYASAIKIAYEIGKIGYSLYSGESHHSTYYHPARGY